MFDLSITKPIKFGPRPRGSSSASSVGARSKKYRAMYRSWLFFLALTATACSSVDQKVSKAADTTQDFASTVAAAYEIYATIPKAQLAQLRETVRREELVTLLNPSSLVMQHGIAMLSHSFTTSGELLDGLGEKLDYSKDSIRGNLAILESAAKGSGLALDQNLRPPECDDLIADITAVTQVDGLFDLIDAYNTSVQNDTSVPDKIRMRLGKYKKAALASNEWTEDTWKQFSNECIMLTLSHPFQSTFSGIRSGNSLTNTILGKRKGQPWYPPVDEVDENGAQTVWSVKADYWD